MLTPAVKPKERASFPTRFTRGNEAERERVSGQMPTPQEAPVVERYAPVCRNRQRHPRL